MKTIDVTMVEDWVKAVRTASKFYGINYDIYATNRNKANDLEKQLMSLDFDFGRDNIKRTVPHLFAKTNRNY